jgi:serine/threonine protein kinase
MSGARAAVGSPIQTVAALALTTYHHDPDIVSGNTGLGSPCILQPKLHATLLLDCPTDVVCARRGDLATRDVTCAGMPRIEPARTVPLAMAGTNYRNPVHSSSTDITLAASLCAVAAIADLTGAAQRLREETPKHVAQWNMLDGHRDRQYSGHVLGRGVYGTVMVAECHGVRCAAKIANRKEVPQAPPPAAAPPIVKPFPSHRPGIVARAQCFHRRGAGQEHHFLHLLAPRVANHIKNMGAKKQRVSSGALAYTHRAQALRTELAVLKLLSTQRAKYMDGMPVASSGVIDHDRHVPVVELLGERSSSGSTADGGNEHQAELSIFLRLYDGDLQSLFNNDKLNLLPLQRAILAYDICSGMAMLHDTPYMHRDLKMNNVLVLYDGTMSCWRAVVSDFGCAMKAPKELALADVSESFLQRIPEHRVVYEAHMACKTTLKEQVDELAAFHRPALARSSKKRCNAGERHWADTPVQKKPTIVLNKPSDVYTYGQHILLRLFDATFFNGILSLVIDRVDASTVTALADFTLQRCFDNDDRTRATFAVLKPMLARIVNML